MNTLLPMTRMLDALACNLEAAGATEAEAWATPAPTSSKATRSTAS